MMSLVCLWYNIFRLIDPPEFRVFGYCLTKAAKAFAADCTDDIAWRRTRSHPMSRNPSQVDRTADTFNPRF